MQFFFRTSENTGVGVGPLGLLIAAPIYLMVIMLIAAGYVLAFVVVLVMFAVRAIRERRRRKLHAPDE